MTLDVRLTSGATEYRLQVENVRIQVVRNATGIPLPSNLDPIFIDFGQRLDIITLSGTAPLTNGDEGGIAIPSALTLRNISTDDYANIISLRIDSQFDPTANNLYDSVKIQNLILERSAIQIPEAWSFVMTLVAREVA